MSQKQQPQQQQQPPPLKPSSPSPMTSEMVATEAQSHTPQQRIGTIVATTNNNKQQQQSTPAVPLPRNEGSIAQPNAMGQKIIIPDLHGTSGVAVANPTTTATRTTRTNNIKVVFTPPEVAASPHSPSPPPQQPRAIIPNPATAPASTLKQKLDKANKPKRAYVRKLKKKERTGSNNLRLYHERRRAQIAMERAQEETEREMQQFAQTDPTNPRLLEYHRQQKEAERIRQEQLQQVQAHQASLLEVQRRMAAQPPPPPPHDPLVGKAQARMAVPRSSQPDHNPNEGGSHSGTAHTQAQTAAVLQLHQRHQQPPTLSQEQTVSRAALLGLDSRQVVQLEGSPAIIPHSQPYQSQRVPSVANSYLTGALNHVTIPAPAGTFAPYLFSPAQMHYLNLNATMLGIMLTTLINAPGFNLAQILPSNPVNRALLIQNSLAPALAAAAQSGETCCPGTNPNEGYMGNSPFTITPQNLSCYALWLVPLFFSFDSMIAKNCLQLQTQFQFPHRDVGSESGAIVPPAPITDQRAPGFCFSFDPVTQQHYLTYATGSAVVAPTPTATTAGPLSNAPSYPTHGPTGTIVHSCYPHPASPPQLQQHQQQQQQQSYQQQQRQFQPTGVVAAAAANPSFGGSPITPSPSLSNPSLIVPVAQQGQPLQHSANQQQQQLYFLNAANQRQQQHFHSTNFVPTELNGGQLVGQQQHPSTQIVFTNNNQQSPPQSHNNNQQHLQQILITGPDGQQQVHVILPQQQQQRHHPSSR